MNLYKAILKPILFKYDPEKAHYLVFNLLRISRYIPFLQQLLRSFYSVNKKTIVKDFFGLKFKNPVGLAAGFDKDGKMIKDLSAFGFGFIEVGTVTPLPQSGNDKPRLFRLLEDEAIINRMGFNNHGVKQLVKRLKNRNSDIIIGGNIGKNKNTPNDKALDDYVICFKELFLYVDYFVVNVSSPNTPNLRELQEKEPLRNLLKSLNELNTTLAEENKTRRKPILLKIAPDLTENQLDDIIEIIFETGIDGIVATNTTISRAELKTPVAKLDSIGLGGLSGKPIRQKSTEVIRYIHTKSDGKIPIIGVGGIHSPEDAKEKLDAGASLVQVYTGFIYEGPSLIKNICNSLARNQ